MNCANPDCQTPSVDLSTGVLRLLELEVPPEERVVRSDGGFPVCSVPTRYFWLCPACSSYLKVRRWTLDGVILERRTMATMSDRKDESLPFTHPRSATKLPAARKTA
jgi:hypothetical protein